MKLRGQCNKWVGLGLSAATVLLTKGALAYCPCYTASSSNNTHNCGVEAAPGTNPSNAEWADIFDLVSKGPAAWGSSGPDVADIGQGCGKPEPLIKVPPRYPCELLKAIAMVESGWRQFCVPDQPDDQIGGASRTIISFDCGYGIGQVTSGMHTGENPGFDRERVASDPTYNLATGTRILADKWRATECVGDNQPSLIEDWYTATWAYNGLAYKNNPNNPDHDPNRGVYDPQVGGSYPYQEKVFGRIENPPSADYWPSVALAYPDRANIGTSNAPPELPEPACAGPTDCNNHRTTHVSSCLGSGGEGGSGGGGTGGSTGSGGTATGGSAGTGGSGGGASKGGSGGSAPKDAGAEKPVASGGAGASLPDGSSDPNKQGVDLDTRNTDSGCSCGVPGDRRGEGLFWIVGAALLSLRKGRRRRQH